jgi:hypothetical protein
MTKLDKFVFAVGMIAASGVMALLVIDLIGLFSQSCR